MNVTSMTLEGKASRPKQDSGTVYIYFFDWNTYVLVLQQERNEENQHVGSTSMSQLLRYQGA